MLLLRLDCGFLGPSGCSRKADNFTFADSSLRSLMILAGGIFWNTIERFENLVSPFIMSYCAKISEDMRSEHPILNEKLIH